MKLAKQCAKCDEVKDVSQFYKHPLGEFGHDSKCIECAKKYARERRQDPKASEKINRYDRRRRSTPEALAARRARMRVKRKADLFYILSHQMRGIIRRSYKKIGTKKAGNTVDLLGYSPWKLKERIECQFKPGMSWKNYGDWHIDHKKPIVAFVQQGITDPKTINHLCNLQPMWAIENLRKSSKWQAVNDNKSQRKSSMRHDNDNAPPTSPPIRFLSVCSGIEAASVAFGPLGWEAVAFAEIEKFPSQVLTYHYPDVPNLGDFTKIDCARLGRVDVLCGGTPCQAFSVAGARRGLKDARGNLTLSFVELAHELADGNGLRNVVWENVVGVLSDKTNAFGCFLAGLVGAESAISLPKGRKWPNAGMVSGPKGRAAWRILDAQYFGVAQRRRRVLVVADFGNGADPAAVLFERVGMQGNSAPSREAGKGVAPTISARTKGGGGLGTDFDLDGGLDEAAPVAFAPEIARCDATREGSSQDYESTTMVAVRPINTMVGLRHEALGERTGLGIGDVGDPAYTLSKSHSHAVCVTGAVTHTLKAEGADASEDGTGRGTPIVAFDTTQITSPTNRRNPKTGDPCHPLSSQAHPPAITVANRGREGGATVELGGHVATALRASQGGGDKPHVLTSAVRRLTPKECERLQGFKDNYTRIPLRAYKQPHYTKNRPADMWQHIDGQWWLMSADGPRYKALGNSWAVPKFVWLGGRLARLMPATAAA